MDIASELVTYLANEGVGVTGTSLFVGEISDGEAVDDLAVVANIVGGERDKYVDFRHAVGSLVIRSKTYADGITKYDDISALLHKNPNCISEFVAGGHEVKDIYLLDEPTYAAKDSNQRYIFEFQIQIDYV